jgi:hypothetical protein
MNYSIPPLEVHMDESRMRAYRVLLAQGLLHLKWDLARFYGGLSLSRPWRLFGESRVIRATAFRAFAFHNLAIFSASDFVGFSEDAFWADIDKFRREFPEALCPYHDVFERCMRGESVSIISPRGDISAL